MLRNQNKVIIFKTKLAKSGSIKLDNCRKTRDGKKDYLTEVILSMVLIDDLLC